MVARRGEPRPAGRDDSGRRGAARGRDYVSYALAIEALARASATVAVIARRSTTRWSPSRCARRHATRRSSSWLRRLARGDGDRRVRAVRGARGIRRRQPADRGAARRRGYRISGRKVWVANAEAADVAIVFARDAARTARPRHQRVSRADGHARASRGARAPIRSACAASAAWTSISTTCASTPTRCSARRAKGFALAMWALDGGRVAIAAQALGVGQAALDEALAYAKTREAFGQPIAQLPGDPVDARRHGHRARRGADADVQGRRRHGPRRRRPTLEAAMAKLFASEAAHRAADKAMQILASAGYRRGSRRRAAVPRRPRDRDLSGHVGSPAHGHRRAHPGRVAPTRSPAWADSCSGNRHGYQFPHFTTALSRRRRYR